MGQILIGYHGCDITTRDGFVSGTKNPKISRNSYDWLYDGLYFFEGDCDRALKLATAASERSTCWRRFKIEPPCRLNFEPGLMANL